ncbi:hypothetical protein L596_005573 [Steinernema carpocapsae]|uniref:histone acetyltransferase n=1 Tax=Steinernema carpocapsae TaxID=34508 RepID=A0A4V6I8N4_STECR|nr:hypothetical protein L596_005573 [Steinernema carpocapsae]
MGRGRPPLVRDKPPVVVDEAGPSMTQPHSITSEPPKEPKKRGRKRKIPLELTPVNVASPASTSSEDRACSASSTSPTRRALTPYFKASARRRRLHQRGEYALLSGKHRRIKHASPSSSRDPSGRRRSVGSAIRDAPTTSEAGPSQQEDWNDESADPKTPKTRGYKASTSSSSSAALLKKARNSARKSRSEMKTSRIAPVSTSTKNSKRNFNTSTVKAVAAQPVQVQRTSEECRSATETMAKFNTEVNREFYEDVHAECLKQRAKQMEYIVENKGKALPAAIQIGRYFIKTWYSAPYPQEFASQPHIYVCPYCLHYSMMEEIWERHAKKCYTCGPPGNEIYRYEDGKETISVFEVDGNVARIYCQNLCLLSKLFLDSKTLFYDVEPFLFYVLTKTDQNGFHFIGYFSKEKYNTNRHDRYHLSCIMTLPCFQKKGYGRFLIDFSYLLARIEQKPGTPEKPLSELGEKSFKAYWRALLIEYFNKLGQTKEPISLKTISEATAMTSTDIRSVLKELKFLKKVTGTNRHRISVNWSMIQMHMKQEEGKKRLTVDEELLKWTPKVYLLENDYQIPGASGQDEDLPAEEPTQIPPSPPPPPVMPKIPRGRKKREPGESKSERVRKPRAPQKERRKSAAKNRSASTTTPARKRKKVEKPVDQEESGKKPFLDSDDEEKPNEERKATLRKPRSGKKPALIIDATSDEDDLKTPRRRRRRKSTTNSEDHTYRPSEGRPRGRKSSVRKMVATSSAPEEDDDTPPIPSPAPEPKQAQPDHFLGEEQPRAASKQDDESRPLSSISKVSCESLKIESKSGSPQPLPLAEKRVESRSSSRNSSNDSDMSRSVTPVPTVTPVEDEKVAVSRTCSSLSSQTNSTRCHSVADQHSNDEDREESRTPTPTPTPTPTEPERRCQSVQSNQSYTVNMGGDPNDVDDDPTFTADGSPEAFPGYGEADKLLTSACKPMSDGVEAIVQNGPPRNEQEMPNLNSIVSEQCGSNGSDDDIPPTLSPIYCGPVQATVPAPPQLNTSGQEVPVQMPMNEQMPMMAAQQMPPAQQPYMNDIQDGQVSQTPYQMHPASNGVMSNGWMSQDQQRSNEALQATISPSNSIRSVRSSEANLPSVDYDGIKMQFSSPPNNDLMDAANSERSGRSSTFSIAARPDKAKEMVPPAMHPMQQHPQQAHQQVPQQAHVEPTKAKPNNRRRNTVGAATYPHAAAQQMHAQYPHFQANMHPMAGSGYFPNGNQFAPTNYGYTMYPQSNPQFHQAAATAAMYPGAWNAQAQYAAQYNMQKQGMAQFPAAYYMAPGSMQMNGAQQQQQQQANNGAAAANFVRYPNMDANGSQSFPQFYNSSYGFMPTNMPLNP